VGRCRRSIGCCGPVVGHCGPVVGRPGSFSCANGFAPPDPFRLGFGTATHAQHTDEHDEQSGKGDPDAGLQVPDREPGGVVGLLDDEQHQGGGPDEPGDQQDEARTQDHPDHRHYGDEGERERHGGPVRRRLLGDAGLEEPVERCILRRSVAEPVQVRTCSDTNGAE
jgi:hypothetical protein